MSRRAQDNLVALAILGVFVAAIVASLQYGPRARLVPIPIAGLGAILVAGQLLLQNTRSEKDLKIDLLEVIAGSADPTDPPTDGPKSSTQGQPAGTSGRKLLLGEIQALGLVLLLVALFILFGPLPAMFLFMAGYFVLSRHLGLAKGIVHAAAYTLLVYAVFSLWLRIDLMRGVFDLSFGLI
jgi:hypothetical protein